VVRHVGVLRRPRMLAGWRVGLLQFLQLCLYKLAVNAVSALELAVCGGEHHRVLLLRRQGLRLLELLLLLRLLLRGCEAQGHYPRDRRRRRRRH
jgi:hypothetical protein